MGNTGLHVYKYLHRVAHLLLAFLESNPQVLARSGYSIAYVKLPGGSSHRVVTLFAGVPSFQMIYSRFCTALLVAVLPCFWPICLSINEHQSLLCTSPQEFCRTHEFAHANYAQTFKDVNPLHAKTGDCSTSDDLHFESFGKLGGPECYIVNKSISGIVFWQKLHQSDLFCLFFCLSEKIWKLDPVQWTAMTKRFQRGPLIISALFGCCYKQNAFCFSLVYSYW